MNYYDENDDKPKLYGGVAAAIYTVVVAALMFMVYIPLKVIERPPMEIVLVEQPPRQPQRPVVTTQAPRHQNLSTKDNTQQVTGTDQKTQTVNRRAIFHSNKGGVDEPEDLGNPYAREGEENLASGDGGGLNPIGNDQLDEGLRGRGLLGNLPVPSYPGNVSGKIVIRVTVDQNGRVTSATYEPKGSTSSDAALIAAAVEAAKRARFTESRSFAQGGTITYNFRLN
jgi:TonB family protein